MIYGFLMCIGRFVFICENICLNALTHSKLRQCFLHNSFLNLRYRCKCEPEEQPNPFSLVRVSNKFQNISFFLIISFSLLYFFLGHSVYRIPNNKKAQSTCRETFILYFLLNAGIASVKQ